MVINLVLATNYNLKTDILRAGEEAQVIETTYLPMLDFFSDLNTKSNHFPVGLTLETLASSYPDVIVKMKSLQSKGLAEFGSHTFAHPIVPITPYHDMEKQVVSDIKIHESIFGKKPNGFYPPEFTYDATLPKILREQKLEWIMLLNNNVVGTYGSTLQDTFRVGRVAGIEGNIMPCVFVYGDDRLELKEKIFKTFEAKISSDDFVAYFWKKLESDGGIFSDSLVLLYFDVESPYFARTDYNTMPQKHLQKALEKIYSNDNVQSIHISDAIRMSNAADRKEFTPLPFVTFKPFSMWTEGSEKLDALLNEARQKIHIAEVIRKNDPRLSAAWRYLMIAEGSDARSAVSKRRQQGLAFDSGIRYGNMHRVIENYEYAIKARQIAEDIINEYKL